MKVKKTYKDFIKESFNNDILPVGSKIQFKFNSEIKNCEIIGHRSNMHNDVFYLIRLEDGSEEYIVAQDKRIIQNIKESKKEIKSELKGNDYEMVSGIIDILKKVKDVDNRMEIAKDMISQFKREDIKFDYDKFLDSIK